MRTTYQNTSMRFGFFAHALFVPKTPNAMGFSGSVNGTTKNPGFLDFGFCQCKWAYYDKVQKCDLLTNVFCCWGGGGGGGVITGMRC